MSRFSEQVVIVTGGASGLGRVSAMRFASEGAKVVVADVSVREGQRTADAVGGIFVETDVGNPEAVNRLVDTAVRHHGRLDVMFNNAGIRGPAGPIEDISLADYHALVRVNLDGVVHGMQAALKVMLAQGGGVIVNTASNGGISPTADIAAYCATKAAVVALTKASAIELAPKGVRVNCICPGVMLSGMTEGLSDETIKLLDKLQPIGRPGDLEEMAEGVLFLASPGASYVIGHALVVDGGAVAGRQLGI
ncbi:short-chain dehydrogenase [Pandoraea captiosa]|uniref:Short-chain dehydrogenase n=1 Tax=Pandoraea captiosa TaxID=2508302 RepID=A0A5E5AC82_9BURK|nr:SDR family NAD(P)-dependent oxidoreductase [Pandoraea captiosa]VVE70123.1 short-chain dehydrogenase [Pandoraea captiosa]